MNFTLEALDKVIEATGCSYQEAKEILEACDGDADIAIATLKNAGPTRGQNNGEVEDALEDIKNKITEIVKEGQARKIVFKKKGEEIIAVPLDLGILGGIIGICAAPVAMIVGAIAAYGLDCTIEVVRKDGSTDELK